MIVVTPKQKTYPLQNLATTVYGEHAYYADPGMVQNLQLGDRQRTGVSISGEEWFPNFN